MKIEKISRDINKKIIISWCLQNKKWKAHLECCEIISKNNKSSVKAVGLGDNPTLALSHYCEQLSSATLIVDRHGNKYVYGPLKEVNCVVSFSKMIKDMLFTHSHPDILANSLVIDMCDKLEAQVQIVYEPWDKTWIANLGAVNPAGVTPKESVEKIWAQAKTPIEAMSSCFSKMQRAAKKVSKK